MPSDRDSAVYPNIVFPAQGRILIHEPLSGEG